MGSANIWNKIYQTLNIYATNELLTTLLAIAMFILKIFINNKVSSHDLKKSIIEIPSEVTLLALGFFFSSLISETYTAQIRIAVILIMFAFITILCQYALEKSLKDDLANRWRISSWLKIIFMYIASIFIYGMAVFGGVSL